MINDTYHYPPELFDLMVRVLPKLVKGKDKLLYFFEGSGVRGRLIDSYWAQYRRDKDSLKKTEMAKEIIAFLNRGGDELLNPRRELLRRVTALDDFSGSYEDDRMEAFGLVAKIRDIVNIKDSFTRINIERNSERRRNIESKENEAIKLRLRNEALDEVRKELGALFCESNASLRGKKLEGVLNRIFELHGFLVSEAFVVRGDCSQGIIEQIDGVIALDGTTFLVEVKWYKDKIGVAEIASPIIRAFERAGAGIYFISASGFTDAAIEQCKNLMGQKKIVLGNLEEIVLWLEHRLDIADLFRAKVKESTLNLNPYCHMHPNSLS